MRGENQLIERIVRAVPSVSGGRISNRDGVTLGIGDDAALLGPSRGKRLVLSCDAFLEGVHFAGNHHPADAVGYKSLARATSDLAAMGAKPEYFLLTLGLPMSRTGRWLDEFLQGLARAAREFGMKLIGGDTTRNQTVSISVTVVGEVRVREALTRRGARPGDWVYVTGTLGEAAFGLRLLKRGSLTRAKSIRGGDNPFLKAHLYPRVRSKLALWLAQHNVPSAMMDISDGLSTDLDRLCRASSVGARIWAERIPRAKIPSGIGKEAKQNISRRDILELAIHGGDDYELLFTVPPERVKKLTGAPEAYLIAKIGVIERGNKISLVDASGRIKILKRGGWDPFAKR